ncbi:MAG: hypothetical protein H6R22_418, partial [Chromatiaceae bacterium]|nr:hypothetical protein [Chromatiaceae bacterium]
SSCERPAGDAGVVTMVRLEGELKPWGWTGAGVCAPGVDFR